jgi:hypothetical protein
MDPAAPTGSVGGSLDRENVISPRSESARGGSIDAGLAAFSNLDGRDSTAREP